MEPYEESSDVTVDEPSPKLCPSSSLSWMFKAKEIRAARVQNYFTQSKRTGTVLTSIAFSIGMGSLWRFPYLCHRNGGGEPAARERRAGGRGGAPAAGASPAAPAGSFILIYFLLLLFLGIPLLYLEMMIGQWLRVDNIRVWKRLVPWLGGLSYVSILVQRAAAQGHPRPRPRAPHPAPQAPCLPTPGVPAGELVQQRHRLLEHLLPGQRLPPHAALGLLPSAEEQQRPR